MRGFRIREFREVNEVKRYRYSDLFKWSARVEAGEYKAGGDKYILDVSAYSVTIYDHNTHAPLIRLMRNIVFENVIMIWDLERNPNTDRKEDDSVNINGVINNKHVNFILGRIYE